MSLTIPIACGVYTIKKCNIPEILIPMIHWIGFKYITFDEVPEDEIVYLGIDFNTKVTCSDKIFTYLNEWII